jgi:transcriptional regulator NrdR family protein
MSKCRHTRSQVTDSREEGHRHASMQEYRYLKRRRRKCIDCGHKFTTYEMTREGLEAMDERATARLARIHAALRELLEEDMMFPSEAA